MKVDVTLFARPLPVTGLTSGKTYYFVVTGVNGDRESAESDQVSATPG